MILKFFGSAKFFSHLLPQTVMEEKKIAQPLYLVIDFRL